MNKLTPLSTGLPLVIQGGMGIGVSNWKLARAVSVAGQLGVISGTALNTLLVRRLQSGDDREALLEALNACPLANAAERILKRYLKAGFVKGVTPYTLVSLPSLKPSRDLLELTIVAAFVEVYLAKQGHEGVIGINLLEKIQIPTLPTLFGAMLAGVDYVIMGAGIPRSIPGVLDAFAKGEAATLRVDVLGKAKSDPHTLTLDPENFPYTRGKESLKRPRFLGVISSNALATTLARKSNGEVFGFIVEASTAGGHNAPSRSGETDAQGEPVYGPRDSVNLEAIRSLGKPFWLAGSRAHPEGLRDALAKGATGVQIGSAFAFCEESGITPEIKKEVLSQSRCGQTRLRTDARISPTGLPFKVLDVAGTLSETPVRDARVRRCDLGYLRLPYAKEDGTIGYRCPAAPPEKYEAAGGKIEETRGRQCLCNGLFAAIGHAQRLPDGRQEPALITAGAEVGEVSSFLREGRESYRAEDVLHCVLAGHEG